MLVDSHAHLQLSPLYDQVDVAMQNSRNANVYAIVVNALCPGADWDCVEALCAGSSVQSPLLIPSFGLHPWWIEKMLTNEHSGECIAAVCASIRSKLTHKVVTFPMAGVGECGLDKAIKKQVHLDKQEALLRVHLEVAIEYQRPISLHCVGSWGRMFDTLMYASSWPCSRTSHGMGGDILPGKLKFSVILHSCNKMPVDMYLRFCQLTTFPIYYSFNGRQIDENVGKLLALIPKEKLLIETDSPDQLPKECKMQSTSLSPCNEPANIAVTCDRVSALMGERSSEIADITTRNALQVFTGEDTL